MHLINSSIVLVANQGIPFVNPNGETKSVVYNDDINFQFNPLKLIFIHNFKKHNYDFSFLKKRVKNHIQTQELHSNIPSIGINFVFVDETKQYEAVAQKFIKTENKLPKFENKSPKIFPVNVSYDITDQHQINLNIQRLTAVTGDRKTIVLFDINMSYNVNDHSIEDLIDNLDEQYNKLKTYIKDLTDA